MNLHRMVVMGLAALGVALGSVTPALAQTPGKKPNILVIWGDDSGVSNISAYNLGLMGYKMPGIDRIAKEGAIFTYLRTAMLNRRPGLVHPTQQLLQRGAPGSWSELADPSAGAVHVPEVSQMP